MGYHKVTHIAMKCLSCGVITVYPKCSADGRSCGACGGQVAPTGEAVIGVDPGHKSGDITLQVDVNGLDEAINKMNQLELAAAMAVGNIKVAQKLLGLNDSEEHVRVSPSPLG